MFNKNNKIVFNHQLQVLYVLLLLTKHQKKSYTKKHCDLTMKICRVQIFSAKINLPSTKQTSKIQKTTNK